MIRLIKPCIEYWLDYLGAMRECVKSGDIIHIQKNAAEALRSFNMLEVGVGLPPGVVPCSYFWLLNNRKFIGVGYARHYLNNDLEMNGGHAGYLVRPSMRGRGWEAKLLSLIIKECGKTGIKSVLITHPESDKPAADAANRSGCRVFDRITLVNGSDRINIVRRLADTKINIRTWREPAFEFKSPARITGEDVDLVLVSSDPATRTLCPTYHFDIVRAGSQFKVGQIDLRIGYDPEIFCSGNIGYSIVAHHRGRGYAAKAARLTGPLARAHHMKAITITCNPDNLASSKTAENLGAYYLELIRLPKSSGQYKQGDRFKRRYIWPLL